MANITKRLAQLPAKIEELCQYVLIGKQVLKAQKAKYAAICQIEKGLAAKQAALNDTQDMAELLLLAEARFGDMLAAIPAKPKPDGSSRGTFGGRDTTLPSGINKKESHYAQELSKHQDIIATVVAKAREQGEVPVRQHVLRDIRLSQPKSDTPPLPEGKYSVIYADPPWKYDNSGLAGAAREHYNVMNLDEICGLPVADKTGENSVLFCWATNPFLEDVFRVINAWGFAYKTNMCWQKEGRATYGKLGFYVYGKHELLLIATKGSMLPKYIPESIVIAKKSEHSRKPDEFYGIIEKMYPAGKYLELFARKKHNENWEVWGLEV